MPRRYPGYTHVTQPCPHTGRRVDVTDRRLGVVRATMRGEEVVIVPYRDGPYLVRGPMILRDQDGQAIELTRRTVALCRCGKSQIRPFCDGTHRTIRFHAPSRAEDPRADQLDARRPPASQVRHEPGPPSWIAPVRARLRDARSRLRPSLESAGCAPGASDAVRSAHALIGGAEVLLDREMATGRRRRQSPPSPALAIPCLELIGAASLALDPFADSAGAVSQATAQLASAAELLQAVEEGSWLP